MRLFPARKKNMTEVPKMLKPSCGSKTYVVHFSGSKG